MNRIARTIAVGALLAAGCTVTAAGPAQASNDLVRVTVDSTSIDTGVDLPTKDVNGWE